MYRRTRKAAEARERRTRRVDVYAVTIDGRPWKRAGLSAVLEGIRKACPRVASPRALA